MKEKGVDVLVIQASKIDEKTLGKWLKDYNIPFHVGTLQGDVEKRCFDWGIHLLPWTILTDRNHIIRAGGFRINELDEKIGDITNVER